VLQPHIRRSDESSKKGSRNVKLVARNQPLAATASTPLIAVPPAVAAAMRPSASN